MTVSFCFLSFRVEGDFRSVRSASEEFGRLSVASSASALLPSVDDPGAPWADRTLPSAGQSGVVCDWLRWGCDTDGVIGMGLVPTPSAPRGWTLIGVREW